MQPDQFNEQLTEQFERATQWLKRVLPKLVPLAVGALLVLWLSSGVYSVNPGQVGVVRTFGKETARTAPGLNFRFPWPFQQADVVSVEQIRRIEVGFRGAQRVPGEALMLTGDENFDLAAVYGEW